ncbi:hypothetical protein LTR62_001113 [Meristemomyces frigidus]|uniref:Uncharacterized protein n=1 Tax=Meristemomyces frigidus TaxID=1508187 RepID=A0AAN7YLS8_9PEZI|nr:hypothetical protein LTR62_001113 [Meristemomyces frigidus]
MGSLPARAAFTPVLLERASITARQDNAATSAATTATPSSSSKGNITANIPLTTIFTPNADCFDLEFGVMLSTASGPVSAFRDFSAARQTCYPSRYSKLELSTNLWFSPGVCPSGLTRASQMIGPTTTSAWCCPSSMAYSYDGNRDYCSMYVATSTTVRSGSQTAAPLSNFIALQWPVSVQWQSTDLDVFSPASAPLLVQTQTSSTVSGRSESLTAARSATESRASVGAATATAAGSSGSGGLSTGAEAGIGAGIGALALVLIGLAIWIFLRRRRNKRAQGRGINHDASAATYEGMKAELPGSSSEDYTGDAKGHAMQTGTPVELESERDGLNEMDGFTTSQRRVEPVELPGNTFGEHAAAELGGGDKSHSRGRMSGKEREGQIAARRSSREPLQKHA